MTHLDAAVRNNASWCAAMLTSHGLLSQWTDRVWSSPDRTPPLYPDAVTLTLAATAGDVLGAIDLASPGASVKDSFATLDLSAAGFEPLFDATWLELPAVTVGGMTEWTPMAADTLPAWVAAWGQEGPDLVRPSLLDQPGVTLLGEWRGDALIAGAAVHASDGTLGVSNLFASDGDLPNAWRACLATLGHRRPGVPLVGYESGTELEVACSIGARRLGPLRVWIDSR